MLGNLVAVLALAGPVAGVPSGQLAPTEPAPANHCGVGIGRA
ncbi:hypothetical protein [Paractinoplanes atraurantiacus]|nr:hypothetical protein [Actinoplanes atraurantiacus]